MNNELHQLVYYMAFDATGRYSLAEASGWCYKVYAMNPQDTYAYYIYSTEWITSPGDGNSYYDVYYSKTASITRDVTYSNSMNFVETVESYDRDAYPDDDRQGGFWYVIQDP